MQMINNTDCSYIKNLNFSREKLAQSCFRFVAAMLNKVIMACEMCECLNVSVSFNDHKRKLIPKLSFSSTFP